MLSASLPLTHQLLHICAEQDHTLVQCFTTTSMHTYGTCACQAITPHTTVKAKPAHCLHTLIQHQKKNPNLCRQLLIFQQPRHKPICPLQAEEQVLWDASSCFAYTQAQTSSPQFQHRLANIPLGNLNHTVLVIRHCPHLEIKASTPWIWSTPLPQAQVPQSLPAQDGHSALLQPCTPTSGPGFLQAKILVNK